MIIVIPSLHLIYSSEIVAATNAFCWSPVAQWRHADAEWSRLFVKVKHVSQGFLYMMLCWSLLLNFYLTVDGFSQSYKKHMVAVFSHISIVLISYLFSFKCPCFLLPSTILALFTLVSPQCLSSTSPRFLSLYSWSCFFLSYQPFSTLFDLWWNLSCLDGNRLHMLMPLLNLKNMTIRWKIDYLWQCWMEVTPVIKPTLDGQLKTCSKTVCFLARDFYVQ